MTVDKKGWVDVKTVKLPCEEIWQLVMEVPMTSMKFSVSAIEVNKSYKNSQREQGEYESSQCRYILLDGSYFQYNRAKGKVSKVITLD